MISVTHTRPARETTSQAIRGCYRLNMGSLWFLIGSFQKMFRVYLHVADTAISTSRNGGSRTGWPSEPFQTRVPFWFLAMKIYQTEANGVPLGYHKEVSFHTAGVLSGQTALSGDEWVFG